MFMYINNFTIFYIAATSNRCFSVCLCIRGYKDTMRNRKGQPGKDTNKQTKTDEKEFTIYYLNMLHAYIFGTNFLRI